ncbi:MAG TPA: condensation domain-containing protein, partial [Pyrinomonadaceae bacterium]|nr:condensation domain-containing protein [Pyrinomonadaceae bacterium]
IEFSDVAESEREAAVREFASYEAAKPFDLGHGPLLRVKLVRLGPDEHMLLLTMHHIVSDGWSMPVLIREVSELYSAFASGREPQLEELPIQYADYASWQRDWLQGEVLDEQVQYWRKQLTGAPQVLELPTDKVRPAVQSHRGGHERFVLDAEVSDQLRELSRSEGVTMFMLLLAAFQVLLMRYSNSEDIVVGTDVAGRRHREVEGLIGFFVNQLVIRTDLSGNPTFKELLQRVREVCLGAYSHQDLPFEKLVEELQPERDLSHSPLFQTKFLLQNEGRDFIDLHGLDVVPVNVQRATARFDLTVVMIESQGRIVTVAEYNQDLYETRNITQLLSHFEALLRELARDAEQRIGRIELLGAPEQQQLLAEWNDTKRPYAQEATV